MGDFGIFDLLYIVGLILITALTFALLVVRFLPLILGAVFGVIFQILSLTASLLASLESQPKRRYRTYR